MFFKRTLVALLAAVACTLGVVVVDVAPAHAAYTDCATDHFLSFGWIGDSTLGGVTYTGVSQTAGFQLEPETFNLYPGQICQGPYEGQNSTCMTVRLVVLWSDVTHETGVPGPWVRSCWTGQLLASSFVGWVRYGDYVYVQARAEEDGDITPAGHLYF